MTRIAQQKTSRKPTEIRRQEIIDAGMRILTTEGARLFTADRLGSAVGITGGSIFRHFASMDEILDSIVDRIEEIIFENFPPRADDPLERLRLFYIARVQAVSEHPDVSRLLLNSMLIPSGSAEERERRLREFKLKSQRFVLDCMTEAKAGGLLDEDVNPEEGGVLVLGSIHAIGHLGIRGNKAGNARGLAERTWRLVKKSLRHSPKETDKQ